MVIGLVIPSSLAARRWWRTGGLFAFVAYLRQAVHLAALDAFPRKCVLVSWMSAAEPMADGGRKAVRAFVTQPPGAHLRRTAGDQVSGLCVPDGVPHGAGRVFIARPVIPAILVVALSAAGSAKAQIARNVGHYPAAVHADAGEVLSFIHGRCHPPAFLPPFTVLRGCWFTFLPCFFS